MVEYIDCVRLFVPVLKGEVRWGRVVFTGEGGGGEGVNEWLGGIYLSIPNLSM